MTKPWRLLKSGLTGRVYITSAYSVDTDGRVTVTGKKYDFTSDAHDLMAEAWHRGFTDCDQAEPGATVPNPYRPREDQP